MSEVRTADELRINAPVGVVSNAIEDPAVHACWHPFVSAIAGGHELHEIRSCLVQVGTKEGTTTERCTEREESTRIAWAIEEDSTGFARTVSGWRSGFSLAQREDATVGTAQITFRPSNVLMRAMLPLIRRKFHQTQRAILRGLHEAVEGNRAARAERSPRRLVELLGGALDRVGSIGPLPV